MCARFGSAKMLLFENPVRWTILLLAPADQYRSRDHPGLRCLDLCPAQLTFASARASERALSISAVLLSAPMALDSTEKEKCQESCKIDADDAPKCAATRRSTERASAALGLGWRENRHLVSAQCCDRQINGLRRRPRCSVRIGGGRAGGMAHIAIGRRNDDRRAASRKI